MIILALLATVLAIEICLSACVLISSIPIAVDQSFVHSLMIPFQRNFHPQRNILLYGLGIFLGVGIFACLLAAVKIFKSRKEIDFKFFLLFHAVVVFFMGHAAFEAVSLGNPVWAWPLFWIAFAGGLGASIFWPEFTSALSSFKNHYVSLKISPWVAPLAGCVFIFLVIFMPDLSAVVAMVYQGEYFHNWDFSLFGAVYALTHGLLPCIDVTTTYGFGAAVLSAQIIKLMGGFDYARMLGLLMIVGIVYFVLWFLLLRRFLASTVLAFAAIVWAIRLQLFNQMIDPFVWAAPMSSVFRYCFDIGVFWMLWMHLQSQRTIFLAAGAFIVSLGMYHILSTGISMFLVFGLYGCLSAFVPGLGGGRNLVVWRNHALVLGSVFLWTVLWFYLTVGGQIFNSTFLHHLLEFNSYFITGALRASWTGAISGNSTAVICGLLYPVFYLGTFLYVAGEIIHGKARARDVFAGLLAFYGLEIHAYYILMFTQWYTLGMPGIFLFFYWVTKVLEKIPAPWHRRTAWILAITALYCLFTDRPFIRYPNLLSVSRNPIVDDRTAFRVGPRQIPYFHQLSADFPEQFKLPVNSLGEKDEQFKFEKDFPNDAALKSYYAQQTAWPEDTALIRRLTPDGSKVAVLSSFELLLLQRSQRKPFFYYFPIINSRPLTGRTLMVTLLFGYPQLQKTIDQLEAQKPPYIFMERIFLTPQVPQAYFYEYDDLISLLRYVLSKYEPAQVGKYLVAMKRKEGV